MEGKKVTRGHLEKKKGDFFFETPPSIAHAPACHARKGEQDVTCLARTQRENRDTKKLE